MESKQLDGKKTTTMVYGGIEERYRQDEGDDDGSDDVKGVKEEQEPLFKRKAVTARADSVPSQVYKSGRRRRREIQKSFSMASVRWHLWIA